MSMESLQWGLMMMVVGMGVVFALLFLLTGVLMLIGRLDRPKAAPEIAEPAAIESTDADDAAERETPAKPTVRIVAEGLDEDQVAAITVAVVMHAETRRRKAAPETRAHAPGSQLFASRWLSVGRGLQNNPFTRR